MTRRPIFVGVATVLALALTAGLAYGAGRLVGTQGRNAQTVGDQQTGTTSMVPGSFSNHPGQASRDSGYGAFVGQMRGWMRDWMRDHRNHGPSWRGAGYGPQGAGQSSRGPSSRYSGGPGHGYWDDHHTTSGHWNGPTTGGYGSGGYHHDGDDRHDDCW